MRHRPLAGILLISLAIPLAQGCKPIEVHHKIDPITLNINIRLEKQLDEFFDFQDPPATPSKQEPAAAK